MTELLLITDVPRLDAVFSVLNGDRNIRLRIANSLEKGDEEILARKPDVIFIQTHLSGLSGEILLLHLKKLLGRRRSRFVLLGSPDSISTEAAKQFHGAVDTSADDEHLLASVREQVDSLTRKKKPAAADTPHEAPAEETETPAGGQPPAPPEQAEEFVPALGVLPAPVSPADLPPAGEADEPPVTYAPQSRLSVYSEFTSSFDEAVEKIQPAKTDELSDRHEPWVPEDAGEPAAAGNKGVKFLLWFAPVVIAVIVVTMIQHRGSKPKSVDVAPDKQKQVLAAAPVKPTPTARPEAAPAVKPAVPQAAAIPEPKAEQKPAAPPAPAAANVKPAGQAPAQPASGPKQLPEFVPRYGYDKAFSASNPGWERYKGQVTEFKIHREGGAIKAIQVIDRGGEGIPESFLREVLQQTVKKPKLAVSASDKKDGYEVQRGTVNEHVQAVLYRDAEGGRLRAFVLSWH